MPPAQQQHQAAANSNEKAKEKQFKEHKTWVKKVEKGIHKILDGPRRHNMSDKSKKDLLQCLDLMWCKEELSFDWNLDLYINPPPLRSPRVDTDEVGELEGDKKVEEVDSDKDEDDGLERPVWRRKEVHIIATQVPPYWALARLHKIPQNLV